MTIKQFTTTDLESLKTRNLVRAEEAKAKMGKNYILHPSNRVSRIEVKPLVLSNPNASFNFVK